MLCKLFDIHFLSCFLGLWVAKTTSVSQEHTTDGAWYIYVFWFSSLVIILFCICLACS